MRNFRKLAFVTSGIFTCGFAFAQTCATPRPWLPDGSGAPSESGTTCGGADSVSLFCGSLDSAGKPDVVYRYWLAPMGPQRTATSITVAGGAAGFTPTVNIYSDACSTADVCVTNGDPTSPVPLPGVAGGTYFMAVSAASTDTVGACGPFQLVTNGTFPVLLQSFSVE